MENYILDEAVHLLKQPAEYLQRMILFSGEAHPILKPCVFFPEPASMRLAHRNADIYVKESGIEHTMKSFNTLPDDPAEAARQKRINRHWPEDALTSFKYPQVMLQGLFELTFYPEHMDMTEAKESGRIQLYRGKAVCAPLANAAVDRIMNNWYAMSRDEISRAKDRTRQEVGDMVILTQGDLHYLIDTPASIPLSDIRITDRMLTEYAASEGITIMKNRTETPPAKDRETRPTVKTFTQEEVAAGMVYYTIEKAAERFISDKLTPEWLLKQMVDPDKDSAGRVGYFLTPSWFSEEPLLLKTQEAGDSLPGWFSGWFEVGGTEERGRVRNGEICFDSPARYLCLLRDSIRHIPCDTLMIPVEDLRISQDEIEFFAERTGRKLKPISDDSPAQERAAEAAAPQQIKLPIIGGREVIPVRLLLLITEPQISPRFLVEALWNPRGDYLSCLRHEPFYKDWTLFDKELKKIEGTDYLEKQLKLLPSGVFVTRTDFEAFEFYQKTFQIKQGRPVPEHLRIIAFEGFDASPATFHRSPKQTAQKDTRQAKGKKEAATTDLSEKMAELKKGKIKANSEAVDKFLTAYHQTTGKKAADHNDLLRHMRDNPKVYQLAGFSKDEAEDRFIWIIPRPKALAAERDYYSKKQIVRKIKDRMKCNENSAEETPPTTTA